MVLGKDGRGADLASWGKFVQMASSAMPVSCHCSFQVHCKRLLISRPNIKVMELDDKPEDFDGAFEGKDSNFRK